MVGWLWGKHCLRSPQTGLINVIIIINCSSNSLNVTFASLRKCLYLVEIHSTFTSLDFKEPTSLYKMQQMYNPSLNDNILEMTLNTSPLLLLLSNVIWSYCWQWFTVSTHTCILLTVVHCQYTHTCTKNRLRSVTLRKISYTARNEILFYFSSQVSQQKIINFQHYWHWHYFEIGCPILWCLYWSTYLMSIVSLLCYQNLVIYCSVEYMYKTLNWL